MSLVFQLITHLVRTNAARLVAYSSTIAVAGALFLAGRAGVELSPELLAAVGTFAAVVATEAIRLLVYSMQTTQGIADRAADTGNTDIGTPPSGDIKDIGETT